VKYSYPSSQEKNIQMRTYYFKSSCGAKIKLQECLFQKYTWKMTIKGKQPKKWFRNGSLHDCLCTAAEYLQTRQEDMMRIPGIFEENAIFGIDTETTGLRDPHPIEFGAVRLGSDECFQELMKPCKDIEEGATRTHGICAVDLDQCSTEAVALQNLANFLRSSAGDKSIVLVAHNARFDKTVITKALERSKSCEINWPEVTWFCTRDLAKTKLSIPRYTLEACCEFLHIPYKGGHRALADAQMCASLFEKLFF